MFETRNEQVVPPHRFARRVLWSLALSAAIAAVALMIGVIGFHFIAGLDWIDALHNASMILGGMGPVSEIHTDAGKVFASLYALYSGLIVLVAASVLIAPVLHRFLHRLHMEPVAESRRRETGRRRRA